MSVIDVKASSVLEQTMASHLVTFAIEEARLSMSVVAMDEYLDAKQKKNKDELSSQPQK